MSTGPGAAVPTLLEAHLGLIARRGGVERELVRDWSLRLRAGEAVGIVGESGSGKTLCALALTGLLPSGVRVTPESRVRFEGRTLAGGSADRAVRGRGIGMVFQHPRKSLNPLRTVGAHLVEVLCAGAGLDGPSARARARELLVEVELEDPDRLMTALPDELSGGMAQRVGIALGLALDPRLLIADEPTSALDGSVRRRVLDLLGRLREARGMALLLISHDLGVVAHTCTRVAVQYAGRLVEEGPAADVLAQPRHPYTAALLAALPRLHADKLPVPLPGRVGELGVAAAGCVFRSRCPSAESRCASTPLYVEDGGVRYACWLGQPAGATHA